MYDISIFHQNIDIPNTLLRTINVRLRNLFRSNSFTLPPSIKHDALEENDEVQEDSYKIDYYLKNLIIILLSVNIGPRFIKAITILIRVFGD